MKFHKKQIRETSEAASAAAEDIIATTATTEAAAQTKIIATTAAEAATTHAALAINTGVTELICQWCIVRGATVNSKSCGGWGNIYLPRFLNQRGIREFIGCNDVLGCGPAMASWVLHNWSPDRSLIPVR